MNDTIYDSPKSALGVKRKRSILSKAWKGEIKLWKTFWFVHILGFVLSLALGMLFQMAIMAIADARLPHFVTLVPFAVVFPITLVCLWRASPNPKVSIKGALAKFWVCLAVVYYFGLLIRVLSGSQ